MEIIYNRAIRGILRPKRIYLSPPHMGDDELKLVREAFDSNWIAPVGPHLDKFEQELAEYVQVPHAVAVTSGTAAIHLALRVLGIQPDDEVLCSTFTFCASANPILYEGAQPVFIDSDYATWNMDPQLLADEVKSCADRGKLPRAVILVHLYGQSADFDPINEVCSEFGIPIIEDAAEALGATYRGKPVGGLGTLGVFSFNGNKIITTSGGGMLVSHDRDLIEKARFLATQARDPAPHYHHSAIGFNYRMSNVLAAIGRGQLRLLKSRIEARRHNFTDYVKGLGNLPGVEFMPEATYGQATRWLTCLTLNPEAFGADREQVRLALESQAIEARPVWKPLHTQPIFSSYRVRGGHVSETLFEQGLCFPSGSSLTERERHQVIETVRSLSDHV